MSFSLINTGERRHLTLQKGMNDRWPKSIESGADRIYVCKTHEEVANAANEALNNNYRITVRSGGHCYEGFVSNKLSEAKLAIIDLGEMKGFNYNPGYLTNDESTMIQSIYDLDNFVNNKANYNFAIFTGNQNWDSYVSLYKTIGKTLPGGSCYSVGVGGHFSGGGYGLLSRLHGCVVDHVTGIDILVPDGANKVLIGKHVRSNSLSATDRDLFTACLGAGGGNFGIIIRYYFDQLPDAPQEAYWTTLSWNWSDFNTKESFSKFLEAYYNWFYINDKDSNSDLIYLNNGGLFSLLKLNHEKIGGKIVLAIQYTNGVTGRVGTHDEDLAFDDFISTMINAAGIAPTHYEGYVYPNITPIKRGLHGKIWEKKNIIKDNWLTITMLINGSGPTLRGKYKSSYQRSQFTKVASEGLYDCLRSNGTIGRDLPTGVSECVFQIDSYGGNINSRGIANTSVAQRNSLLKTQYQIYWRDETDPSGSLDTACEEWIKSAYDLIHADTGGRPTPGILDNYGNEIYQGCYINYPDIDMLESATGLPDSNWLKLYYYDDNLIDRLKNLKIEVDPNNIFHHQMSIPI